MRRPRSGVSSCRRLEPFATGLRGERVVGRIAEHRLPWAYPQGQVCVAVCHTLAFAHGGTSVSTRKAYVAGAHHPTSRGAAFPRHRGSIVPKEAPLSGPRDHLREVPKHSSDSQANDDIAGGLRPRRPGRVGNKERPRWVRSSRQVHSIPSLSNLQGLAIFPTISRRKHSKLNSTRPLGIGTGLGTRDRRFESCLPELLPVVA
jgi:hypothetical protein